MTAAKTNDFEDLDEIFDMKHLVVGNGREREGLDAVLASLDLFTDDFMEGYSDFDLDDNDDEQERGAEDENRRGTGENVRVHPRGA